MRGYMGRGIVHGGVSRPFETFFPLTENPISESGYWVGGQSAGGNLWGDCRTTPGFAFGVSQPNTFSDPTAILTGVWGPDQTVEATIKINNPTPANTYEAEVRVRNIIDSVSHLITGYEIYGSCDPNNPYMHIASWGGPYGAYVNFENSTPSIHLVDGDILKAVITGTNPVTITGYLNGVAVMTATDDGTHVFSDGHSYGPWPSGNPGFGFYDGSDNNWTDFGHSHFKATDQ